ncbi:SEC-C metal-binding domain-containing protein [Sporomusa sp. KB1]|uniref:SEC-C metal-binding domain-containing protein n=1 Tax=Sporomusa sp. KB1 TaxID=943346 RepID=UPI0011A6EFB6
MSKPLRDKAPCPCGSGNKYEKCCKDRKPRYPLVAAGVHYTDGNRFNPELSYCSLNPNVLI